MENVDDEEGNFGYRRCYDGLLSFESAFIKSYIVDGELHKGSITYGQETAMKRNAFDAMCLRVSDGSSLFYTSS